MDLNEGMLISHFQQYETWSHYINFLIKILQYYESESLIITTLVTQILRTYSECIPENRLNEFIQTLLQILKGKKQKKTLKNSEKPPKNYKKKAKKREKTQQNQKIAKIKKKQILQIK